MEREPEQEQGDFVQSLARGLSVIRAFDAQHPELSLTEAARRAGIPPAAARRFLHTLQRLGYVRGRGRSFSLTPKVLELGFSYLSALTLPEVMQPHLERLSRAVDESVSAAVLAGGDIVYIARVPTRRIMTIGITIGTSFPAYATSMGRVLLADLPGEELRAVLADSQPEPLTSRTLVDRDGLIDEIAGVRDRGFALVDGELELGLRAIAVPVRGRDGTVAAAINISSSASRGTVDSVRADHLPALREAAAAIEADLRLL